MNHLKKLVLGTTLLPMAVAVGSVQADELQDRVNQLEQQLAELKEKMKKDEETPGVTIKKGTTFNYGGFIKVDAMWSKYGDGEQTSSLGEEIYVPSTTPVGGESSDTEFNSHVKTSRLWFKTSTQTSAGVVRSHIETDFLTAEGNERISNSAGSRLRHAYLAWDYSEGSSLLVGQTWSTFFNVGALPEAIDFIGPTAGTIFARQNQIRWTTKIGGGSLMLAAENPSTSLYINDTDQVDGDPRRNNNYDDNAVPDLIARYNGKAGKFSYSVAGMMREIAYDYSGGTVDGVALSASDDSTYGYGVSFSGKWMLGKKDDLKFMVSQGTLGRYLALQPYFDGVIDEDGDVETIDQIGGYVAYRHWWSDKWRSTISYAMSEADLPSNVSGNETESVSNASVNLIYSPTKNLSFGGEYLVADRELKNGTDGDMDRLQFMAKWAF